MKTRVCSNTPMYLLEKKWSKDCLNFALKCLMKSLNERWSVKELMDVGLL